MTLKSSRLARLLLAASLLPVCALAADPTVRRIQVVLDGPGAVADAYVLGHVAFREGQPFSREAAADTVRSLYATGRFSQAEVLPSLDATAGQVDVRIRVQLRPLVESVTFTGLEDRVDEDDLLEDLAVKAGDPLDPVALNHGRNKALERLRKKRPFAGLEVRREETADGRIRLVAAVTLTPELRIDTVSISGASQLDESDVLASAGIKSASWRWWKLSGLSGGGRLGADEYREDCERLVAYYRAQGFLDAELETTDAALACVVREIEGDEGWVDVVFRLREGRRYAVGTVSIAGNNLGKAEGSPFSSQALLGLISNPSARAGLIAETTDRLASGGWYSGAAVDVAIEKIREAYGRRGHLDVQIAATRSPNLETSRYCRGPVLFGVLV
jgi:outer membrane protein assembly factor BamA